MMKRLMKTALAVLALAGTAQAGCHNCAPRMWQEFTAFKRETPQATLTKAAATLAELDDFFTKKYPQGQCAIDPSMLDSEEAVQRQQVRITADYKWLQAKMLQLRQIARQDDPAMPSLVWLSMIEVPVLYEPRFSRKLLQTELPKMASYQPHDAFTKAKYETMLAACAASIERQTGTVPAGAPGTEAFYRQCGMIQPDSKRIAGHMTDTHAILDNVTAILIHDGKLPMPRGTRVIDG